MSILVALTGANCGVVATDGRRVEETGQYRDDFAKTVRLGPNLIGGYVGLLVVNGTPVAESMRVLVAGRKNIDAVAEAAKHFFEGELMAHGKGALEKRRLDLVLLGDERMSRRGSPTIRGLTFRAVDGAVTGTVTAFRHACAGDPTAHAAVNPAILAFRDGQRFADLRGAARHLIEAGIEACGVHEDFPEIRACGGDAHVLRW